MHGSQNGDQTQRFIKAHKSCDPAASPSKTSADRIIAKCDAIKAMLLAKNEAYGDSALNPVRVFSKASAHEQIMVRIDDKLSRLARGSDAREDVLLDLAGYVVLALIARDMGNEKGAPGAVAERPSGGAA